MIRFQVGLVEKAVTDNNLAGVSGGADKGLRFVVTHAQAKGRP